MDNKFFKQQKSRSPKISKSSFEEQVLNLDKLKEVNAYYEKAFKARLAYEKNCIAKYDQADPLPSKPIPRGERMSDYAAVYGVTVQAMKDVGRAVDEELKRLGLED